MKLPSLCTGAARASGNIVQQIVRALAAVGRAGGRGNALRAAAQKSELRSKGSQPSATLPLADPSLPTGIRTLDVPLAQQELANLPSSRSDAAEERTRAPQPAAP